MSDPIPLYRGRAPSEFDAPRDVSLGRIFADEINCLDGECDPTSFEVRLTADNEIQLGPFVLADPDQVINLLGCLIAGLRILRIQST
jgi:hypothetical protein